MEYRNIKTGAIVISPTEVHGKDWVLIDPVPVSVPKKGKKKAVVADGG